MGVIVEVPGVEYGVQQRFLGREVVQQSGRTDAGLPRDLRQRRVAPAVARQQGLRGGENALLAVLTFGEQRLVRPRSLGRPRCRGRHCHRSPSHSQTNQLNTQ